MTNDDFLKYSARYAYKALKRVTKRRNPDFKFEPMDRLQQKWLLKSSTDSLSNDDEELDSEGPRSNEKPPKIKSFDDFIELPRVDVEFETRKSDDTISRTISTGSRSTSGSSPEFVYPEKRESAFERVLSLIPKMSSFPRKNRDRCLPCMLKPFEAPLERNVSFSRTALRRIINRESVMESFKDTSQDGDSISVSVPSFESEIERIHGHEVETSRVTFEEKSNGSKSRVVTVVASSFEGKREQLAETVGQKSIPESESPCKAITKEAKGDQRDDDITSTNLNDPTASSARVTSLERTKVPSSFHSGSSGEDDSIVLSISDDQPKPKYLVPCHAPTNFRPSLEPLRALRNRKPTTLQDRIALLESTSTKRSTSTDDYASVSEKPGSVPKEVLGKDKTVNEGKPAPPPLTKAKSVAEKLTLEKKETRTERRPVLRRGSSCSSFPVSTDTASNKTEMHRDASKEASRGFETIRDDNILKTPPASDSTMVETKLPLAPSNEIARIIENLDENATSTSMLEVLCKEFLERLSSNAENDDSIAVKRKRIAATLTGLLVESKRYLYPDKFPSDLLFSTNQPPSCNSGLLKRILPLKTFNLVAPLLGMAEYYPKKEAMFEIKGEGIAQLDERFIHKISSSLEVVTWRPLTKRDLEGYDPDATLEMRADNSMKRICQDFCQWVESLGGTDNVIDEEVLRDMFEIDFTAEACRAMQVSIEEMPVVPAEVALTRNCPGASKLNMTKRHVARDARAEETPAKIRAFGTAMPWELRFVPPNNQVRVKWLQCENVPKDIETMEVVWKDITHLRSVRGFVEWLQQHPEVPRPQALKKIASMDIRRLRQAEDDEMFAHLEVDANQIKSLRVDVNGGDV
ncbi:unnamed protein product [Xylocopa violacea]|uniref:Uncharacterized protein n=1 Tax=Xylocopa violacea TaxID=135666 RepID=A0ABP1N9T8_XYLVO